MKGSTGRAKQLVLLVVTVLAVSIVVIIVMRALTGSSEGQVTVKNPQPAGTLSGPLWFLPVEDSVYAQFSYRSDFAKIRSEKPVTPVVEAYNYLRKEDGFTEMAVQITRLETGSLDDSGTYHYRSVMSGRYTKDAVTVNQKLVVLFTDEQGDMPSVVAFLQKGNLSASIALSGGAPSEREEQRALLLELVERWQWK